MVAPEREPLGREVEIDEFFLGGLEEGLRGGRQRGKKTLVGVAVEVRGRGPGRLRLQLLADASGNSLGAFVQGYAGLRALGFEHRPRSQKATPVGEQLLPRAHRAVSDLMAWPHGTHRYAPLEHLPAYLDEYVLRHNRRGNPHAAFQTRRCSGLSARHEPATYRQIIDQAS